MGVAAAIAASTRLLPWTKHLGARRRAWVTAAAFLIALVPFNGFPVAAYVRGATGDLSITTLALLCCALLRPWISCATSDSAGRQVLLALIALAAIVFYPMALGFGALDPYRLGYANGWFLTALQLLALTAWFRKHHLLALCVSLAVLAWAAGWYESRNLWDYLLDPFVSIYALSALVIHAAKSLQKR